MKAIATITAAALTTIALTFAIAPVALAATAPIASEVAILFAHSDAINAAADAAIELAAAADTEVALAEDAVLPELIIPDTGSDAALDDVQVMGASTINVSGHVMSYIDFFGQPAAPTSGAGLWLGDDATTDGSWGYFVGHNPGDFSNVINLAEGDAVTVCDDNGNARTYNVVETFTVTAETRWVDIADRINAYGECIGLQCCVGDGTHYRVVVAA